jgi:YHS domain-containing protein
MPQTFIAFITLILFFFTGLAQQSSLSVDHFNTDSENLVANGYDVVSYFTDSKPVKEKQSISTDFQGLLLYFSSHENKRKFLDDPEKYLPKYGGWCAYAIGNAGKKVDVDPFSYTIENGELYLFYKLYFNDTREKWIQNHKELQPKAENNWQKIIQ